MIALVVLYNAPRFFEHSLKSVEAQGERNASNNVTDTEPVMYTLVYEIILYCIVAYFIPLVLLIIFNTSIVIRMCQQHRQFLAEHGRPLNEEDLQELTNITRVMLVIIVVFIVTQTPASVNQPLYYLLENEYCSGGAYFYYFHISNLFASSYSCLNFIVYCACRQNFRIRLWQLCNTNGAIFRRQPAEPLLHLEVLPLQAA